RAAAAGGGLAWAGTVPDGALAAGVVGGTTSLLLPGLGLARFRRRTFGAAFERIHAGGRGGAPLPARTPRLRPSRLLDPADRLRLEGAIHGAEEKSAAAFGVTMMQRCAAYEAAGWRGLARLGGGPGARPRGTRGRARHTPGPGGEVPRGTCSKAPRSRAASSWRRASCPSGRRSPQPPPSRT